MSSAETKMVLVERRMAFPGEHELREVRSLSRDELGRIRADSQLIAEVGSSSAFQRLQAIVDTALERTETLEQRDSPSKLEVESCLAGVRAAVEAQSKLEDDLEAWKETFNGGVVSGEFRLLGSEPAWRALVGLSGGGLKLHKNRNEVVGISGDTFLPLKGVLAEALIQSQGSFSRTLVQLSSEVADAGKRIREIQVECPEGVPCLLPKDIFGEDGKVTFEDVPVNYVTEALRITRVAKMVLEESNGDEGSEYEALQLKVDDELDDQHESVSEDSNPDDPFKRVSMVDASGLISLAATLNDELENAWSGALDRAALDEGIAAQMSAVRVAIAGLVQHQEHSQVRVEEPEPSPEYVEKLEKEPGGAVKILILAQMTAFAWAARMIEPLSEPSRVQVKWNQNHESLEKFWDSGAFANLRGQLELVRRMLDTDDSEPSSISRDLEAQRHLRLAQASWFRGDPEACLFHAAVGLSVKLEVPAGDLENDLNQLGISRDAAVGLRTLKRILNGESSLPIAAVSAIHLADAAVEFLNPDAMGESLSPQELFDLMAEEMPLKDLQDD